MSVQSRSSFSSALHNYRHFNIRRRTLDACTSSSSSSSTICSVRSRSRCKSNTRTFSISSLVLVIPNQNHPKLSWKKYHHHHHLNSSSYLFSSIATETRHPISYDTHSTINSSTPSSSSSTPSSNQKNNHKIKPFLLTDIGEGITEVELLQWYIQPNQKINQFDNVCQVQSDKATVDITSRYDGIVHSLNGCDVGDMIQVGQPLLFVRLDDDESDDNDDDDILSSSISSSNHDDIAVVNEEKDKDLDTIKNHSEEIMIKELNLDIDDEERPTTTFEKRNNDTMTSSSSLKTEKFLATPAVRKLIKENNIDISSLQGTGPNGRILKGDILNFLGFVQKNHKVVHNDSMNQEDTIKNETVNEQQGGFSSIDSSTKEDEVVPIRGYHRLMVNSMATTLQVPHMTYSDEVEMTNLMKMRHELNDMLQKEENNDRDDPKSKPLSKVSFLPFMIKACSLAIKEYPVLNSSIDVEKMTLTYHKRHDIGVAMDSDRGLVVPVVRGCEDLSILDIALELDELRTLAMNGTLNEKHLMNPTFTLSNIGSIGGTIMSPVVLPPQVAIGAIGKIQRLPRFVNETNMDVAEYHIMNISWGGDHRVIDGATLGRFSNAFKNYIESPMKMAFRMK